MTTTHLNTVVARIAGFRNSRRNVLRITTIRIIVQAVTFGLFLVMAIIGGKIMIAGWNILKPKPETIRVRLKPKHLTQAFEADTATMGPSAGPPPPPGA